MKTEKLNNVETSWHDTQDKNITLHIVKWSSREKTQSIQKRLFELNSTDKSFFPFPIIGETIKIDF